MVGSMANQPQDLTRRLVGDTDSAADLTVVQWNILADWATKTAQKSGAASGECLAWPGRCGRILQLLHDGLPEPADVICLQEVDHPHDLLQPLTEQGYQGHFEPKGSGSDGCCLFVRQDRFEVVSIRRVAYQAPSAGEASWSQIAIVADLLQKHSGRRLQVATTHLKAKVGHEAIRREQVRQLLAAVASDSPVIIAGDFNDIPSSDACALMRAHPLADAHASLLGRDLPWTTWKYQLGEEKKRTIDYIWYTPSALRPVTCLAIPGGDEVEPERLPSWQYPSDHLSLVARFAWE